MFLAEVGDRLKSPEFGRLPARSAVLAAMLVLGRFAARSVVLTASLILLVSGPCLAQDSHYWTLTYGARASLLGGAVIGSVVDLSATYYNPGALPLIEDIDVVMTSMMFHYPNVWMRDIGGTGSDIKSSNLSQAPVVVAGMFKVDWHGQQRVGYSVLTRQSVRLDFHGRTVQDEYALPDTLDLKSFTGDLHLSEELSETWVGLCWARSFGGGIGFGLTAYGTFRHHKASRGVITEALSGENDLALTRNSQFYDYSDYGILLKMGVSFVYKEVSWGLTLTTPDVSIYSDAKVGQNTTVANYDIDDDGDKDTYLAADYQDGLKADYKMPLSLGIGLSYNWRRIGIHFSAEYFFPVDRYAVIDAGDFVGQSHGDTLSSLVTNEAQDVLNFAIGLEHAVSEDMKVYTSFYTDFSARKDGTLTNLSVTDWDIYNVMLGSTFFIQRSQFTLGVGLGWGSKLRGTREPVEIGGDDIELMRQATFEYRMYKFVLGFSF